MSEWISVKEEQPKHKQMVDVWVIGMTGDIQLWCDPFKDGTSGRITDCTYDSGSDTWRFCGGLLHCIPLIVTHWMPMPEPPKEAA